MRKSSIVKSPDGQWTLTRPGYGFHSSTSTTHESQSAAMTALYQRRVSGGNSALMESTSGPLWRPWHQSTEHVRAGVAALDQRPPVAYRPALG